MNKVIVHLFTGKIAWKRSSYDTLSEVCGYTMYSFDRFMKFVVVFTRLISAEDYSQLPSHPFYGSNSFLIYYVTF